MPAFAGVEDALSFGERLRDHRRAAGLTQEELAEQAGLSPRSISELERGGAHIPRRDTVALLARALGLVGAEREAFGAAVERRRGARPVRPSVERTSIDEAPPDASGKHNLPRLLTSFVGRQEELHELAPVLAAAPLLTLVGAGGVGKTRLRSGARTAAARQLCRTEAGWSSWPAWPMPYWCRGRWRPRSGSRTFTRAT